MSDLAATEAKRKPEKKGDSAKGTRKPWRPLTLAQARAELATSVHFYSKCTNTNAAAAGVRLPAAQAPISSELVGFSSTQLDRRHTTYTVGAPLIGPFGQVMSVLEGIENEAYKDIPQGQREICQEAASVLDEAFEIRNIDPRLRQVLMPDESGNYLALTPLHSDKLSQVIGERIREERQQGSHAARPMVNLDLGGSKKQNMARRARHMCDVLFFPAPEEDQALRTALAWFHKGPSLRQLLPISVVRDVVQTVQSVEDITVRNGLKTEEALREAARKLARGAMEAGEDIAAKICSALDIATGDAERDNGNAALVQLTSEAVDPVIRGLIDKRLRDKAWRQAFARALVAHVELTPINREGARLAGGGDLGRLIQIIEEEVL